MRYVHHHVARSILRPEPIACSGSFELALEMANELGPSAIVTLWLSESSLGPCPICQSQLIQREMN